MEPNAIIILHHIEGILREVWALYIEMAPYLLFGLFVAGTLYVFIPAGKVLKHLSGRSYRPILKATLIGIPMPLCSCSVIPVAGHLRREGASRSATLAFLISTPSTGVDSILATYSLMGWLFTVARAFAELVMGLVAGFVMSLVDRDEPDAIQTTTAQISQDCTGPKSCCCGPADASDPKPLTTNSSPSRFKRLLSYSLTTLVRDIGWWLVIGIIIGGVISFYIPADLVREYLGNPLLAYPVMLLIGLPLYVCATGSIPIVAPLIMKGLSPGAALVFLIAGPATNTTTMTFVGRFLGKKALIVYLSTITLCSILLGLLLDFLWARFGGQMTLQSVDDAILPGWIKIASAVVFLVILINALRPGSRNVEQHSHSSESDLNRPFTGNRDGRITSTKV